MARKETIYTVNESTNEIIRASKTVLAALEFTTKLPLNSFYVCTSEFQDLKAGDPISNIKSFL